MNFNKYGDFIINDNLQKSRELYYFGSFRLDAAERRLWCENEAVSLTPKQFDLLFYFVENAGRVMKKCDLIEAVWADTYIEESTLARNVSWLRKILRESADGEEAFIETVSKFGYCFTADVTHSADDENAFFIEERTVQRIRGEETITIEETDARTRGRADAETRRSKFTENKSSIILKFFSSLRLRVSASLILFIAFAALAAGGYSLYQNYFVAEMPIVGLNVKASVTVKNITVDATRETVDAGLKVQPGDTIKVSAMGTHQHGTDQSWTAEGDKSTPASSEYVFQNAAPYSLVVWIGTETDKTYYFQTTRDSTIKADRGGYLYLTINDRKSHYPNNRGGLNVDVRLFRNSSIYAEDDDYKAAWGNELVRIDKEDLLAISGRGSVAYWQNGELYDLDGSDHVLAGLLAPTINTRSLIGKIDTQTPFKVGRNFSQQTMKTSGWLFLSVNDQITGKPDAFKNNNGEIYVDIEVTRQPEALKNPT